MKFHCLNPISPVGLKNFDKSYVKTDKLEEADAVLVRSAVMHEMKLADQTLAVARAGAGVNNIPLDAYAKQGVVVFNTPGANANAVKELVFAGMLIAARDIVGGANWVQENKEDEAISKDMEKAKKQFSGTELAGKRLGIIGLGAIGVKVANNARHFGMKVYGYDPYVSVDAAWSLSRDVKHVFQVEEIFKKCDFITIHVPLTDATREMIGRDAVAQMKKGTVILNFARDLLVDEHAVLDGIEQGKIRAYVTDFPNHVTAGKHGVIALPHLGASTEEAEDNCAKMAVLELRDYLENGNIKNSVNYPKVDMGICSQAARISVCHTNTANMITKFTGVFGDEGFNITDMVNKSKGEFAYTMFDLENVPGEELVDRLKVIPGVFRVRRVV